MGDRLSSLLLFAKAPAAGRVKTRLVPPLSEAQALALYRAFLEDAAASYSSSGNWQPVLEADPDPEDPLLAALFQGRWRRRRQVTGDLGERLAASFEREFSERAPAAVAVGSDHPALELRLLEEAFRRLAAGDDAVVIPADDGGYCAIGLASRVPVRELFTGIAWSSPTVLRATQQRLEALALRASILEPAYDVDRPEDLERLRRDLARRHPSQPGYPRATARVLGIIPGAS